LHIIFQLQNKNKEKIEFKLSYKQTKKISKRNIIPYIDRLYSNTKKGKDKNINNMKVKNIKIKYNINEKKNE